MQNTGYPVDGMYALVLTSCGREVAGDVRVQGGAVRGNVGPYRVTGTLGLAGPDASGCLSITLQQPQAAVLGLFKTVTLAMAGSGQEDGFEMLGKANGHHVIRITVRGRRVCDLAG